ncbi:unnamed protein product, partial [Urochloa humidicola]
LRVNGALALPWSTRGRPKGVACGSGLELSNGFAELLFSDHQVPNEDAERGYLSSGRADTRKTPCLQAEPKL